MSDLLQLVWDIYIDGKYIHTCVTDNRDSIIEQYMIDNDITDITTLDIEFKVVGS